EPSTGASGTVTAAPTAVPPLAPPVSLKIGNTLTLGESSLFIAAERGYFEAESLNVEIIPFDSGAAMIAPLAQGALDAGAGATSAGLFNAMARNVGLLVVAGAALLVPGHDAAWLMTRRELVDTGQLRDYADLRGRTIATTGE